MNQKLQAHPFLLIFLLFISLFHPPAGGSPSSDDFSYTSSFDGTRAYNDLLAQCDFGPRPPGSENLSRCRSFIVKELQAAGWSVTLQNFTYKGVACSNIIASVGDGNSTIILGAHYDTRPLADNDPYPGNRTRPVLGANDGASGTAVLLELARVFPSSVKGSVDIVFFDAEDSGNLNDWDWIVGSSYFVEMLPSSRISSLRAMILLDMVGDAELKLLREVSSTRALQDLAWAIAADLGYNTTFIDASGISILDDHRPFLNVGIPALDIIQHNPFPWYWHTVEDTPDKCSPSSLELVGIVVETLLFNLTTSNISFPTDFTIPLSWTLFAAPPLILITVFLWQRRR